MADGSLKVKSDWLMPFNKLEVPILYTTGNHDDLNPEDDMIKEVKKTKIKHIGLCKTFSFKGVNFLGLDYGYKIRKILSQVNLKEDVPNVVLSHVPEMKPEELGKYNVFYF